MSEWFLDKFTLPIFSLETSTLAQRSISILRCSFTTLEFAFLIVIVAPSFTTFNQSSTAIILQHPCSSPTMHSATLFNYPPSYLFCCLIILTDQTLRCMLTLCPGSKLSIAMKVGLVSAGLFCSTLTGLDSDIKY